MVLVHAFAGGCFAWRLVMQALADRCGRRVVALDRPGSGALQHSVTELHSVHTGLQGARHIAIHAALQSAASFHKDVPGTALNLC